MITTQYVDLDTLDIVSHQFLQKKHGRYKRVAFDAAELAEMNAAELFEPLIAGEVKTGKAVLNGQRYERAYRNKTGAEIVAEAKQAREQGKRAPLTVDFGAGRVLTFDLDEQSQRNITNAIEQWPAAADEAVLLGYAGPADTVPWTLADNTDVPVSLADLKKVHEEGVRRGYRLHAEYQAIKAANP